MKGILKVFLLTAALLVLTGCQPTSGLSPTPTDRTYTIIPVYKDMLDYITAARQAQNPDLEELMEAHVIQPNWDDCAGREYIPPPGSIFDQPIQDLDGLEEHIHQLASSNIEQVVRAALVKSSAYLDGPDTTVCIIAADPSNWFIREQMNGVNGWTFGSGKIILQISPTEGWQAWVPYVTAHEYHHSAWTSLYYTANQPEELIDRIIFEGKADSFAHIVYPTVKPPWTNALKIEQEQQQWQNILAQQDETNAVIKSSYMVGNNEDTPTWTGYTIGFHIVQSYLETHPDVSIQSWTELSPEQLLAQSGYRGGK